MDYTYYKDIFNLALHKEYDKIETINLKRKLYRQSLIKERLENIDIKAYNYKEMRRDDSFFKDSLKLYNIDNGNTFSYNLNLLIKSKDFYLLNFYCKEEDDKDKIITEFCKIEAHKKIVFKNKIISK